MAKYATGKYIPKNPNKYIGNKNPTYRSSWEFTFCMFCDNNPAITEWASESVKIPYFNPVSGKNTVYVPDFMIAYKDKNGHKHVELIEVKPSKETTMESARSTRDKLSVAINMAKFKAAQIWASAQGMTFRVVTEKDLFKNTKK
jgi:hypothetical protein